MSEPLKTTLATAVAALTLSAVLVSSSAWAQSDRPGGPASARGGDFILAVVDQELVTAMELEQRVVLVRENASRAGAQLPPEAALRRQILDALIDERAQVVYARETGQRVDDAELDRAVANVAAQNKVTVAELRQKLVEEGLDFGKFRSNIREQILLERVREREVQSRIRITDADIDALLEKRRSDAAAKPEYSLAQILIAVPDGADEAVVAQRKATADAAIARVRAGESFEAVARELSQDPSKDQGGALGLRPADRWPDVFMEHIRALNSGQVANTALRTGAGFHVLKLVERRDGQAFSITETRARHILLRTSPELDQAAAVTRMAGYKEQIASGAKGFEELAKTVSEDSSAAQGGDLGWTKPGTFVPEFEDALTALGPGAVSDPVVSRFGVHLIQVVERRQGALDQKQERDQARSLLRERKFQEAYAEWNRDLRSRTYVEMREPPR